MIGETLATQMHFTNFALGKNVEGMTHEESLVRAGEGNNANWVLGHLAHARNAALRLTGNESEWADEEANRYARGSACVDADSAVAWEDLQRHFARAGEVLLPWLEQASDEALATKLPEPDPILGETVGSALTALLFHEAYHAGQIGVLRRVAGKPGAIA